MSQTNISLHSTLTFSPVLTVTSKTGLATFLTPMVPTLLPASSSTDPAYGLEPNPVQSCTTCTSPTTPMLFRRKGVQVRYPETTKKVVLHLRLRGWELRPTGTFIETDYFTSSLQHTEDSKSEFSETSRTRVTELFDGILVILLRTRWVPS